MTNALRLYTRYLGISVRGQMQYRASFIMLSFGHLIITGSEFVGILVLFDRFGSLKGWTIYEVAFLYGMVNITFALADAASRGFDLFGSMVKSGDFDRLLLRPRSTALQLAGQETELDKNMIEKLNDPLKHLVRNCIDHGIETREERLKIGKPEEGHLNIAAYLESGKVVIEVSDDGRGINREKLIAKAEERGIISKDSRLSDGEILNLVFNPGLSTAEKVTDLSGRGVGMDVVKNSINELHGNIDIISEEGKGTTFKLYLPLTLAILDGMLTGIGAEKYIIPTLSILEIFRPDREHLKSISGGEELVFFRGNYIPLIRLHKVFSIKNAIDEASKAKEKEPDVEPDL